MAPNTLASLLSQLNRASRAWIRPGLLAAMALAVFVVLAGAILPDRASAQTAMTVTATATTILVEWESDGTQSGDAVTGWKLTHTGGPATVEVILEDGNARSHLFDSLERSTAYSIYLSARWGQGASVQFSSSTLRSVTTLASDPVPPPVPTPSAPAASKPAELVYRSTVMPISLPAEPTDLRFQFSWVDCERDPTQCATISIPGDLSGHIPEPANELAESLYVAFKPDPVVTASAKASAPSGRIVQLALWAIYPHPDRGLNSVKLISGPFADPLRLCLPHRNAEERALYQYDSANKAWQQLTSTDDAPAGHVCGFASDLGLVTMAPPE